MGCKETVSFGVCQYPVERLTKNALVPTTKSFWEERRGGLFEALPRALLKKLFEKSFLRIFKNFYRWVVKRPYLLAHANIP